MTVGVVFEQVDVAGDALTGQPVFGVDDEILENPLSGAVVVDELDEIVALSGCVLRMGTDVEVNPGPVAQKYIAASPPRHDPPEQIARNFVRSEPSRAARGARDAILRLKSEESSVPCPPLQIRSVPRQSATG